MTFKDIWLQRPKLSDIGYGILGFGAYFLVARIIFVFVGVFIPSINLNESQEIGLKNIDSGLLPLVFLALAVLPPLSEEILFRGFFLQRLLKNKVMAVLAGLLVSVTFGVMHRQWNVGIDTFVLSMVMIYTLSLRKSLWVTITMHIIKNTLAFLALFVFKIV
jgi:membrane protease YdiL (CAAX protease family)